MKITENITFLEARNRFASFPLGKYADAARRAAERRLVSAATQVSETDLVPPLPPSGLHRAAQPATAPLAQAAAVVEASNSVGSNAAPAVSTPLDQSTCQGTDEMETEEAAGVPTSAALPVPPVMLLTPSSLAVQAKSAQKGARSKEPGQSGTPRTSDDEMDVNPFLAASERRERGAASKPPEKPKNRITAPKDDT